MITPGTEVAERVTVIESTLRGLGHDVVPAREFDDTWLTEVHSAELIDHLATVWDRWVAGGYPDLGADRVVPYLFPTPAMTAVSTPSQPESGPSHPVITSGGMTAAI